MIILIIEMRTIIIIISAQRLVSYVISVAVSRSGFFFFFHTRQAFFSRSSKRHCSMSRPEYRYYILTIFSILYHRDKAALKSNSN